MEENEEVLFNLFILAYFGWDIKSLNRVLYTSLISKKCPASYLDGTLGIWVLVPKLGTVMRKDNSKIQ
jgi:hypothetical protein